MLRFLREYFARRRKRVFLQDRIANLDTTILALARATIPGLSRAQIAAIQGEFRRVAEKREILRAELRVL